jgi:hypothetical protein
VNREPAREASLQQRDPLALMIGRPTIYLAAVGVPVFAGVMIWLNRHDISNVAAAIASLALTAITGLLFAFASSPLRAPLTTNVLVAITIGSIATAVFAEIAMWSTNGSVRDDWGAAVVALYLLALAPYRPARQIALAGLVSAAVVAVLTFAQASDEQYDYPSYVYAFIAVTPILVVSLGAARFARDLVRGLDVWEKRDTMSTSVLDLSDRQWIARSVQQDRVTLLNQEIVPFLSEMLARDDLTERDREQALKYSSAIRAIMVAEIDRTWLDYVLGEASGSGGWNGSLVDESLRAESMSTDQRTVVRAFVVALHAQPGFSNESMVIELEADGDRTYATVSAVFEATDYVMYNALEPYFAVMRLLFDDLSVGYQHPALTLRFSYGQR